MVMLSPVRHSLANGLTGSKHPLPSSPQLHHRRPPSTLILRGLLDRFHMGMLLQPLPQRLAQNAHAAAMHHAHARQAGAKCPVDASLDFTPGIVDRASDDVEFAWHLLA